MNEYSAALLATARSYDEYMNAAHTHIFFGLFFLPWGRLHTRLGAGVGKGRGLRLRLFFYFYTVCLIHGDRGPCASRRFCTLARSALAPPRAPTRRRSTGRTTHRIGHIGRTGYRIYRMTGRWLMCETTDTPFTFCTSYANMKIIYMNMMKIKIKHSHIQHL